LILYEKGESLPTLEGLLLLAKQSGKTPEEFLSQSLTDQKPRKENQQSHRILYGVGAGILLVGILVAIIVPLSLRNSAQSSVETTSIPSPSPASESSSEETSSSSASSSEMSSTSSSLTRTSSSSLTSSSSSSPSAFSGLTRYWIKTGDGQDGRAQISAGTTTSLEIMSEPLEYFKNQESTYRFSFTLVNEPTGTTLSDGSDYLSRSLFLPSASKGSSFTITTFVSLLADPSQTFVGDVFSVTVL
jgi:cytoskeletal protein RodZ